MVYELGEKDLLEQDNEVSVHPGSREDLEFFIASEDPNDSGRHILQQDVRFWDQYGFRCLYTGYLQNDRKPLCVNYAIDYSYKHLFEHMEYGDLYDSLKFDTVYMEGGYIRKDLRGDDFFRKFQLKLNELLFKQGKKVMRGHIAVNIDKKPAFLWANAVGFRPAYFISRVRIQFPFLKSDAFIRHEIKSSDFKKYPLTIFQSPPLPPQPSQSAINGHFGKIKNQE